MALQVLRFTPGINKESTTYAREGSWNDADKVRFRAGMPEKIGGWEKYVPTAVTGTPRASRIWRALDGTIYLAVATSSKLYVEAGAVLYDVTPFRTISTTLGTNPLTTGASGSKVITVSHTAHGALTGDYIVLGTAVAVDGVPASELNINHELTVVNANSYTITVATTGASSGSTAGGGTLVTARTSRVSLGTDPFIVPATGMIRVAHTAHGALTGDYVTFSGAATVGLAPASALNVEHQITKIDADSYNITVQAADLTATGSVTYSTGLYGAGIFSSTVGGGASVTANYQINTSPEDQTSQYGFGASTWGASTWDTRRTASSVAIYPRTWALDNWGEDLVINPNSGSLYLWDATNPSIRALIIPNAPTTVNYSVVTKDRHLIAFGTNSHDVTLSPNPLDTMMVRWCHQENNTAWTPTVTNTAGGQLLNNGTEILAAADIDQQVLIWTDGSVYSMQYIGPPYTFSFNVVGTNAGVISPRAWIAYSGVIYWMGESSFYSYSGTVATIPCSVQQFVFDALTESNKRKVFAGLNREFGEIMWFYPTATIEDSALNGALTSTATTISVDTTAGYPTSGEILLELERVSYTSKNDTQFLGCSRGDTGTVATAHSDGVSFSCLSSTEPTEPCRYVIYNILSNDWSIGRMERCTWDDKGALVYPLAADVNGYIYEHEKGTDADDLPLPAYVESSDFDLGEGDSILFVSRVIPDFTINSGSVDITLKTRKFAQSSQVSEVVGNVTATTENINTRVRGRQASLRIENSNLNDSWEYGATRIDMRPDGRR